MSDRPKVLDLFCCAGAASVGYSVAGFRVVAGVDIADRPRYPFDLRRGDAITFLRENAGWIRENADLVHASPPCQARCSLTRGTNSAMADRYEDLYPQTREALHELGVPAVIENPSARPDVVLCGEMFGLGVLRHRRFELVNWTTTKPEHRKHRGRVRGWRHGEYHDGPYLAAYGAGGGKATVTEMQQAMGIPWTDVREELTEAIPPAYTKWIGRAFLASR